MIKMVLGTVVVDEDALDVVTGSLAVLLTVSLLLKDTKRCLLRGSVLCVGCAGFTLSLWEAAPVF